MARPTRKRRPPKIAGSHQPVSVTIWLRIGRRELATIVAALRFHRDENVQGTEGIPDKRIHGIATRSGTLRALDFDEITDLCKRLNAAARAPRDAYVRSWQCPACGRSIECSYEDLAESGTPICTDCDAQMHLL